MPQAAGHDHTTPPHGPDRHGHDHGHTHHGHGHHHPPPVGRAFAIGAALNIGLVLVQVVVGLFAGSLSLLADAGHNLGDVLGLLLAWLSGSLARRPPTTRRTYGYGRGTILSALVNCAILLISSGAIAIEALHRLAAPTPVAESWVIWAAGVGIVVNGITALLFAAGRRDDVNIRGVFLHMAGDGAVSAGVLVGALAMRATGALWIDPALGLLIAAAIAWSTWGVLREAMDLAMDVIPARVDRAGVEAWLRGLPGVEGLHDLHIWGISTTQVALTVHLVRPAAGPDDRLLAEAAAGLAEHFGIGHATFQLESGDNAHPCALSPADVI